MPSVAAVLLWQVPPPRVGHPAPEDRVNGLLPYLAKLYCWALALMFMASVAGAVAALLFDRLADWHRRRDA